MTNLLGRKVNGQHLAKNPKYDPSRNTSRANLDRVWTPCTGEVVAVFQAHLWVNVDGHILECPPWSINILPHDYQGPLR